jgi:hypothetical protein
MSVKLTDTQLVMMSAAAQRKDLCLSAPATIKGAALSKVSVKLAKLGLACEIEAKPGAPTWRRDDAGQGYALKLTAAGLKAIALDEDSQNAIEPSEAPQPEAKNVASADEGCDPARVAAPRDGSKLALVIEHLQRADGATILDLTEATGWLPHTMRAALTGLRKRGYLSALPIVRQGATFAIGGRAGALSRWPRPAKALREIIRLISASIAATAVIIAVRAALKCHLA